MRVQHMECNKLVKDFDATGGAPRRYIPPAIVANQWLDFYERAFEVVPDIKWLAFHSGLSKSAAARYRREWIDRKESDKAKDH